MVGLFAMLLTIVGMGVVSLRLARGTPSRTTLLLAALGYVTAVHMAFHGLTTMSFNMPRCAMLLGLICGLVLRCRAMERRLDKIRGWKTGNRAWRKKSALLPIG